MKRISLCLFSCFLCGCVDVGQVSLHPQTTTGYFSAYRGEVESCLENEALRQQHQLQKDDPLPGGTDRFNLLNSQSEVVAWIEVAPFSNRETSVQFYYAPDKPETKSVVAALISRCGSIRE